MTAALRAIALRTLAILTVLVGCVSERSEPSSTRRGSTPSGDPREPLASPVLDASVSSRVQFAIQPLGVVPFDGQVLPRVSPDGRFLATQTGRAPTWEALLAQPGAQIPETSIAIYALGQDRIDAVLPPGSGGLLLGRSATDRGVLVESPRPDGSRWIGLLPWIGEGPRWLVQSPHVNAHAIARDDGTLIWIRRGIDDRRSSIIVRTEAGIETEWRDDAIEPLSPLPCADDELIAFLARTGAGLEAMTLRLMTEGDKASFGQIVARTRLSPEASDLAAYQSAVTAHSGAGDAGTLITLFHPGAGRAAAFDPSTARLRTLAEHSIGAAFAPGGFLVATREDLRYVPEMAIDAPAERRARMSARVWDDPAIAEATPRGEAPFVVLSPSRTGGQIQVFRLLFELPGS